MVTTWAGLLLCPHLDMDTRSGYCTHLTLGTYSAAGSVAAVVGASGPFASTPSSSDLKVAFAPGWLCNRFVPASEPAVDVAVQPIHSPVVADDSSADVGHSQHLRAHSCLFLVADIAVDAD